MNLTENNWMLHNYFSKIGYLLKEAMNFEYYLNYGVKGTIAASVFENYAFVFFVEHVASRDMNANELEKLQTAKYSANKDFSINDIAAERAEEVPLIVPGDLLIKVEIDSAPKKLWTFPELNRDKYFNDIAQNVDNTYIINPEPGKDFICELAAIHKKVETADKIIKRYITIK